MTQLPPALAALRDAGRSIARGSSSARLLEGRPVEPLRGRQVEAALRAAWGAAPSSVLDELDPEPARLTPTSQVHRGVLDGERVAVEVQAPGLAATVRNDLALLDALVPLAAAAFPRVDVAGMQREARERVLDELDLEHQAGTQRSVARALRADDRVVVPRPHSALCESGVLVEDWLDGEPAGPEAAEVLLDASVRLALRDGWLLVDHRPEHVLDLGGGRLGLLRAGTAVRMDRARLDRWVQAALGVDRADAAPIAALGVVADADRALEVARAAAGPFLHGEARLDLDAVREAAERAEAAGAFGLASQLTPSPDDLWPGRGLGQLALTLATYERSLDWRSLVLAALDP